jgi:hypothetical protein
LSEPPEARVLLCGLNATNRRGPGIQIGAIVESKARL